MIAEVQSSHERILEDQEDCFVELCWLILPDNGAEGLLFMLACYLDESTASPDNRDPATCVVGYLASGRQWYRFKREWNDHLDNYGVDVFHTTDFETAPARRGKVYEKWDREKRKTFQNGLIQIIRDNTIMDVGAGIPRSAYDAVMTPQRSKRMGVKNIDELCALLCMFDAGYHAQKLGQGAPAYIYERGGKYRSVIEAAHQQLYSYTLTSEHFKDSTLTYTPKGREYPQTQAADYLAYNWSKEIANRFDPEMQITKSRYPLTALDEERRRGVSYYSATELEALVQEMERKV